MDDDIPRHTAPADDGYSRPVAELTEAFGDDVFEHPDYYAGSVDDELLAQLRDVSEGAHSVRIYRAVPPGITEIESGAWVTLSRGYATQHGLDGTDPELDWPVLTAIVPAATVFTDGNDLNEFGYTGETIAAEQVS